MDAHAAGLEWQRMTTITSRKNPVIGEYRRLAADRDYRRETRSCLG